MRTPLLLAICLAACGGGGGATPDATPIHPDGNPPDAGRAAITVTITSPSDHATQLGSRSVTITGTLDASATVTGVTLSGGGGAPVDATFDATSFSGSIDLVDGDNTITATASTAGASGSATVHVRYPFVTLSSFQAAALELGQPDMTTGADPTVIDARTIQWPYGHGVWTGDTLFVPSSDQNRVLAFHGFPARDGEPGDFAVGQPDLMTTTEMSSATEFGWTQSVELSGGHLYVNDWDGSRVVGFDTPPTTSGVAPDFVIGQTDLAAAPPATGCTQTTTNYPDDFTTAGGRFILSDRENHRVLVWNTIPTTTGTQPDLVLGQGDFMHCAVNDDNQDGIADATPSARTMNTPVGAWSDGTRLFVVDHNDNRVMVWNTFPTTSFQPADFVLGQPDVTSSAAGLTADLLDLPFEVTSNGNQLAIADGGNNRVLVWNTIPSAAASPDLVLGQADFVHGTPDDDNQDGVDDTTPTARTLRDGTGVAFVRDTLMVSDQNNSRILFYGPLPCPPGQYEPPGQVGTCVADPCQPDPCTNGQLCTNDTGSAACN